MTGRCNCPHTQKDPPKRVFRFRMVRARGLEPPWGCPHTDLNRTRLPIPPRPRIGALTRQENMLRHFLILRKREFHIILHPLAAQTNDLQIGLQSVRRQNAKRDTKRSNHHEKRNSRLSTKTQTSFGAFESKCGAQ